MVRWPLRITDGSNTSRADALTFASTAYGVNVAPGEVTWAAQCSLQVIGREIDQLVASVPASLEITAVESVGLEAWELADDPADADRTAITLRWRNAFDGQRTISFRGIVSQLDGESWSVPNLLLREVTAQTGVVRVQHPLGVRVIPQEVSGARAIEPDASAGDAALSLQYQVWEPKFQLAFSTAPKARELHAAMTNLVDVNQTGLDLFTFIDVSPLFDSLFELQVTLPADWEVQEVNVAGTAVSWRTSPVAAGLNEIRVDLGTPVAPGENRSVRLVASRQLEDWPVEATPQRFALPEIRLPQANLVEAIYGVSGDDDAELTPVSITGLDSASPTDLERLRQQLEQAGLTLRLGFTYQDTTFAGQIEVVRKVSRLSGSTFSFVDLGRETIVTHLEAQVRSEGGGIREIKLRLPERIDTGLRFATAAAIPYEVRMGMQGSIPPPQRIVEQRVSEPVDGQREWTLKFDQRVWGDIVVFAEVREQRPADQLPPPVVPVIVGAERQNGYVAVIAGSEQLVTLTATDANGDPLPAVDPVEFPEAFTMPLHRLRNGERRIVASVQYLTPGPAVTLADQQFTRTALPTAACETARLESVIGAGGEAQHEAEYKLIAIGVQSLMVRLPKGHELWSASVNGEPVEVRAVAEGFQLPLLAQADPTAPRRIKLLYRGRLPAIARIGSIRQSPPALAVVTGEGSEEPVEVLEQNWTLHYPDDTVVVDSRGAFATEQEFVRDSLLQRFVNWWRLPSQQTAYQMLAVAFVVLVAFAMLLASLRRFGGTRTIVGVLLLGLIGFGSLWSLSQGIGLGIDPSAGSAATMPTSSPNYDRYSNMYDDAAGYEMAGDAASDEFYEAGESASPQEGMERQYEAATEALGRSGNGDPAAIPADLQDESLNDAFDGGQQGRFDNRFASPKPGGQPGMGTQPNGEVSPFDNAPANSARDRAAGSIQPQMNQNGLPQSATPSTAPFDAPRQWAAPPAPAIVSEPANRPLLTQDGRRLNEESRALQRWESEQIDATRAPVGSDDFDGRPASGETLLAGIVPTRGTGALLSLATSLTAPREFHSRTFRYVGSGSEGEATDLEVTYIDRDAGWMLAMLVAAVIVLVTWWLRGMGCRKKGLLAILLIAGPYVARPLLPAHWSPILDGVLLGGLIMLILWSVSAIMHCFASCCRPGFCCWRPKSTTGTTTLALMLCAGWSTAANADEPVPPPPPQLPATLFVYDDATIDNPVATQVLLSKDEFLKLWRAAHLEEVPAARPPQAGVVSTALFSAELETPAGDATEATVVVRGRLLVENLGETPVNIQLPLGAVAITSAQLDDAPAALVATESGGVAVLVEATGPHVIDIAFRIPAPGSTEQAGSFKLPLQPVASGRLSFALPQADRLQVRVNGSSDLYRITTGDDGTVVETSVANGGDLTVSWQPEATRGGDNILVQSETSIGATLSDTGLTVRHRFRLQTRQGALKEFPLTLPADVRVSRISGDDVAGWEQAEAGDGQQLKLFFRRDITDQTVVEVDLYRAVVVTDAATSVAIPQLVPTDVTRESGDLAIFAEPQLSVTTREQSGLREVNLGSVTMDDSLTNTGATPRFAFRFAGSEFSLNIAAARRQPESRVTASHGAQVELRKTRLASQFQFDLREAPRANLAIRLPEGYLPLEVQADYLSDWTVTNVDGDQLLTLELDQPRQGNVRVLLDGVVPRDASAPTVEIVLPVPVDANRLDSQLGVWVIDAYLPTIAAAGNWRSTDPAELAGSIRELRSNAANFAFRSNLDEPGAVSINLARAVPEFTTESVLLTAVSDASVDYGWTFRWRILRAAADSFTVTTPAWLGELVEFNGPGIRQVTRELRADGTNVWRITLHEPVRGELVLSAVATRPLPEDEVVRIPDVRFVDASQPFETAGDLAGQRRYLVLVNLSKVHRLEVADDAKVAAVDREQLPLQLPEELLNQALEIADLRVGSELPEWRLESSGRDQAASATVLLADIRTVIAHDGSWRTLAEYTVRNRGRQFMGVRPPVGGRLQSVIVRGIPSQAIENEVNGDGVLLVPLPATSLVDLSFRVRLMFAGQLERPLPRGLSLTASEIELPVPQVVSGRESAEFGLPVLQTLWRVDLPPDVSARMIDGTANSNLVIGDDRAAEQAYGKRVIEEVKGQLSLSVESYSQAIVTDNRDNLRQALEELSRLSTEQRELIEEQAKLIDQANTRLSELGQQQSQAGAAVTWSDSTLDRNDFGRSFIVGNNGVILNMNAAAPPGRTDGTEFDSLSTFNFRTQLNPSMAGDKAKVDAATGQVEAESKSRAAVREQLAGQGYEFRARRAKRRTMPSAGSGDPVLVLRQGVNTAGSAAGVVVASDSQSRPSHKSSTSFSDRLISIWATIRWVRTSSATQGMLSWPTRPPAGRPSAGCRCRWTFRMAVSGSPSPRTAVTRS
ncbi:MAG: hypothetical protein R3B90_16465 [Planctomycetaceae bacterium]